MARKQQSSPASASAASAPEPAPEADALAATDTTYLDARPSAAEGRGFVADIVHSMFNPGINASVVIFMNISMLAVFISLIGLGLAWEFNIHVGVLLFADVGLFFSTQWFLFELRSSLQQKEAAKTAAAGTDSAAGATTADEVTTPRKSTRTRTRTGDAR